MNEQIIDNNLLIEKFKKLIKTTFIVIFIALFFGGIGAWYIYQNHSISSINKLELLMPIIFTTILAGIGLRVYRSKLFSSKQEFKDATELFKKRLESKNEQH